ncbi:hypothetical protein HZS92_04081 [Xanthomonas citri pv. citri]|nr:hypothetical protein HZS91_04141 [Xanthomonas citri pv. citri]QYF41944.1 hypothetical protein HZS92_04081 [Xanthomonas citri pv. citri]QYF46760.1 hypothetical protein HZS93_04120 [Xanthomonas citri]
MRSRAGWPRALRSARRAAYLGASPAQPSRAGATQHPLRTAGGQRISSQRASHALAIYRQRQDERRPGCAACQWIVLRTRRRCSPGHTAARKLRAADGGH